MAHNISFEDFEECFGDIISEKEVVDFIDLMYRGPSTSFLIMGQMSSKKMHGLYMPHADPKHSIAIFRKNIENSFKKGSPTGGNKTVGKNIKCAVLQTLAHEIQHANQTLVQKSSNAKFYRTRAYRGRPCEVDARRFVDENVDVIWSFAGVQPKKTKKIEKETLLDSVIDVVDIFIDEKQVTHKDLIYELKQVKANNAKCVQIATKILKEHGVEIVR